MTDDGRLSREQIEELRSELLRLKKKMERSMRTTAQAMKPVELDQGAVGRLSRMDSLQNQGLTRNLQERETARYGQIITSLKRIEEGTFGVCVSCGRQIPFERLFVFPETPTCAQCSE